MWTGISNPLLNPEKPMDPAYARWLRAIYGGPSPERPTTEEGWAAIDPFGPKFSLDPIHMSVDALDP